jgi:hypothetical protein
MWWHLRGNEHGGNAKELQLVTAERVDGEEAVDIRDGEVERVRDELVLLGDLDEPVDEDAPHVGRDVRLHRLDVIGSGPPLRIHLHPPHQIRSKQASDQTRPNADASNLRKCERLGSGAEYLQGAEVGVDVGGVGPGELEVGGRHGARRRGESGVGCGERRGVGGGVGLGVGGARRRGESGVGCGARRGVGGGVGLGIGSARRGEGRAALGLGGGGGPAGLRRAGPRGPGRGLRGLHGARRCEGGVVGERRELPKRHPPPFGVVRTLRRHRRRALRRGPREPGPRHAQGPHGSCVLLARHRRPLQRRGRRRRRRGTLRFRLAFIWTGKWGADRGG